MSAPNNSVAGVTEAIQQLKITPDVASERAVETSELIESLVRLSKSSPKLVKRSAHEVKTTELNGTIKTRTIYSWKMNEWKYAVQPSPFPTLARGLFTEQVGEGPQKGMHRVVARGYDKFFNMNEVPWNTWEALETHTTAPYHLTVKSNGCIIFMAALSPTQILVTSKHSLGPVDGQPISHAQMGEKWLDRHLQVKGKTKVDFAKRLWSENITAAAELCDDSFEEHVLPYSEEMTGLHLHGLNRNQGAFETFSPSEVDAFAREWGFLPTPVITLQSPQEVKDFTDQIGETGKWEGNAVEGFVIRTKVADATEATGTSRRPRNIAPPYPPGSDYFFKIKFDEPYMTYRDWREITRTVLKARRKQVVPSIPKSKLRRPESYAYRRWAEREVENNPKLFEHFGEGKGIIAARERFLQWLETDAGKAVLAAEGSATLKTSHLTSLPAGSDEKWERVVIIPVAVPGCGKTFVGIALSHLFGFGHTQSDDIKSKKTAGLFQKNISGLFKTHNVVYADRNNHLAQHRAGIREAVSKLGGGPIKTLALNWSFNLPISTIHRICGDRVYDRGENHQSLRADETKVYEDVIWQFIESSEEITVDEVDRIVEMNIEDTPEETVSRAVEHLVPLLGLEQPSPENIKEACDVARAYRTTAMKDIKSKKQAPAARYFGILAEVDLNDVIPAALDSTDADDSEVPQPVCDIWESLVKSRRVQRRPHITIVHSNSLPDARTLWDNCLALQSLASPPLFKFRLSNLVTDGNVLAVTIEEAEVDDSDPAVEQGRQFLADLPQEVRARLHITVGTRDESFAPYLASLLVEKWQGGETGYEVQVLPLKGVKAEGRLKGLV